MTYPVDQLLNLISGAIEKCRQRLTPILDSCNCPHMERIRNAAYGELISFYGVVIMDLQNLKNVNHESSSSIEPLTADVNSSCNGNNNNSISVNMPAVKELLKRKLSSSNTPASTSKLARNEQPRYDLTTNQGVKTSQSTKIIAMAVSLQCPSVGCKDIFSTGPALNSHLLKEHGIFPNRCLVRDCGALFSSVSQLDHHINTHHRGLANWPCVECGQEAKSYVLLSDHHKFSHQKGRFICAWDKCKFESHSTLSNMLEHYQLNHGSLDKGTAGILREGPNPGSLVEMAKEKENTNTPIELIDIEDSTNDSVDCAVVPSPSSTIQPINAGTLDSDFRHIIIRNLNCPQKGCNRSFPDAANRDDHLYHNHGILHHRCLLQSCGAKFYDKCQLEIHYENHHQKAISTKKFLCAQCDRSFQSVQLLEKHVKLQHELGHFACAYPGCDFAMPPNGTRHEMNEHQGSAHGFKTFLDQGSMLVIRMPDATLQFSCSKNGCMNSFAKKEALVSHLRLHNSSKCFPCAICPRAFDSYTNLARHFDSHKL